MSEFKIKRNLNNNNLSISHIRENPYNSYYELSEEELNSMLEEVEIFKKLEDEKQRIRIIRKALENQLNQKISTELSHSEVRVLKKEIQKLEEELIIEEEKC